jgi:hypothetical protein
MLKYALRNVLHYRAKYSIAFVLILAFAACLALGLFAFNGFWRQASAWARSKGDVSFYVLSTSALDSAWSPEKGGGRPSARLESEAGDYFKRELKAERVIATYYVTGQAYARRGSWMNVAATSYERERLLEEVDLEEGAFPGEGEALVPTSMRGPVKAGDSLTFVFKNSDLILDSLSLKVSGFFLPTSDTSHLLFVSQDQLAELDRARVPDNFFVFLPGREGAASFVTDAEAKAELGSFARFLEGLSGNPGGIRVNYGIAKWRYDQSKTLIQFFELILAIFLLALVVVAVATIVNVLFTTVVDRIKIIGTFMAFGMTRRKAILLLSAEMLAFSALACTLGILLAFALVGPVERLKFTADNWTIAVILGGRRSLTVIPALWAVGATYLAALAIPFATSTVSVARMLRGEVVSLLHFSK